MVVLVDPAKNLRHAPSIGEQEQQRPHHHFWETIIFSLYNGHAATIAQRRATR
jgi:hypothetical protein